MLPNDILDVVTLVAANWPIMQALLPWFGVMMIVGFGVWLVQLLITDVPQFVQRKVTEKRGYYSNIMRRIAADIDAIVEDDTVMPNMSAWSGIVSMELDELRENRLLPRFPETVDGKTQNNLDFSGQILYRMIPVVEKYGIKEAQARIALINQRWSTNPNAEALKLTARNTSR